MEPPTGRPGQSPGLVLDEPSLLEGHAGDNRFRDSFERVSSTTTRAAVDLTFRGSTETSSMRGSEIPRAGMLSRHGHVERGAGVNDGIPISTPTRIA